MITRLPDFLALVAASCIALPSATFATVDQDRDGVTDYRELKDGTNPKDPKSLKPLSRGLAAYYPFEGATPEERLFDQSGYENHLVLSAAKLGPDRFGNMESALLAENSAGITAASKSNFNLTDNAPRTIAFWVKFPRVNNASIGVGWGNLEANGNASWLGVLGDGRARFWGSWVDVETALSSVSHGIWQHVAFVFSGSTKSAAFYINGVKTASYDSIVLQQQLNTKASTIKIGPWTLQSFIPTLKEAGIDDIRIYGRALSREDIQQLYFTEAFQESQRKFLAANPHTLGHVARNDIPPIRISATPGSRLSLSLPGRWTRYTQSGRPPGWIFDSKKGVLSGAMPATGTPSVRLTPYQQGSPAAQITIQLHPKAR